MSAHLLTRWASRLIEAPLAIHPGKAAAILAAVGGRFVEGAFTVVGAEAVDHVAFGGGRPSMGRLPDSLGNAYARAQRRPYPMVDGVAVIAIEGSLVHKGGWIGLDSGETSYEGLQAQIRAAARDTAVRGVVFEVDSFGGEVSGAFDLAEQIAALSRAKPTIAIQTDHAASAALLLASQAGEIVAPPTGGAGSIGVIAVHVDRSGELAKKGQVVTILTAGAHKAEGNPYEPLPEAVASRWRAELEAIRKQFAAVVGSGRGKRMSAEKAMATEARYFAADEALSLGLIDRIAHPSAAFDEFIAKVNRGASAPYGGASMSLANTQPGANQPEATTTSAPSADDIARAAAAAVAADRARAAAIRKAGASQPVLADHLVETGVSAEAAEGILAAAKADSDAAAEAAKAKAAAPTPLAELAATAPAIHLGAGGGGADKKSASLDSAVDRHNAMSKRR